ncbi:Slit-like 1 protein [Mizuhopecten yessoensis]|uniref:Slit-like 1 protein n=1 Tax=Mizuhopecten yessoensis TaxID=6573 RepID=A0A210QZE3_MIZYE|nr:Slit-like 1 protein [Mizuhopecten yessoensis]
MENKFSSNAFFLSKYFALTTLMAVALTSGQSFRFVPSMGTPKEHLLCPTWCQNDTYCDRCCACHSKPEWDDNKTSYLRKVHVEYNSVRDKALLKINKQDKSQSTLYSVDHVYGRLRYFPGNICSFQHLVLVDFSFNHIEEIANISCLVHLDTLKLKGNKLKYISNTTFINLRNLREVDLSHNLIQKMDPNIFNIAGVQTYHVDVSQNILKTLDITNVFPENALFCEVNYTHSLFGKFVNTADMRLNPNKTYGSGEVILSNCVFPDHPLSLLLVSHPQDYPLISKVFQHGRIFMEGTAVMCDCRLGFILTLFRVMEDFKRRFFAKTDSMKYYCAGPPNMVNYTYMNILEDKNLTHLLVCDVKQFCPKGCKCIEQPSKHRLKVNCENSSFTALPEKVPITKLNVELHLAKNHIANLEYRDYLDKVSLLDLSDNPIQSISPEAIGSLTQATKITLNEHMLKGIPETIRKLDASKIDFGDNPLPCDCDNIWIGDWMRFTRDNSSSKLMCKTFKGVVSAEVVTTSYLDCPVGTSETLLQVMVGLLSALCCMLIWVLIAVQFKFEILLLKRKILKPHSRKKWIYDVFIEFDEESYDVRQYIFKTLQPFLLSKGLEVFIPCADTTPGETTDAIMLSTIMNSKSVLVVLSYGSENIAYSSAFSYFLHDYDRKLILLDFDHSTRNSNSHLKGSAALKRFGYYIPITDRHANICQRLADIFGPSVVKDLQQPSDDTVSDTTEIQLL